MQKVIIAKQVGKNKWRRIVKHAFTKDEIAILIISIVTITYITIRSLV